jgi:hypothetical protein
MREYQLRQIIAMLLPKKLFGFVASRFRPKYAYCVYQGAFLAKRLGYKRISMIEFGVAGGNGLLCLEREAAKTGKKLGIEIDVYGFDTAEGLPSALDYRDLPFVWKKGAMSMNYDSLKKRLKRARLVIGDIRESANDFIEKYKPAPIAAVFHDMDYYSSTKAALRIFDAGSEYLLPRMWNYFDDIGGDNLALLSDYTGERLAIKEFNDSHEHKKLSPAYNLLERTHVKYWHHQVFVLHVFNHEKYNTFIGSDKPSKL